MTLEEMRLALVTVTLALPYRFKNKSAIRQIARGATAKLKHVNAIIDLVAPLLDDENQMPETK